ncbi:MAG TPA: NAD(P)-dependent oxidoreductase, partial [Gemmataceae bacterium]|nr:NAD(P)-dependent oxidoreductase [Gemmataceae bacterium]
MFLVGVTRDFLRPDGSPGFGDIGLSLLERGRVTWEYLPAAAGEVPPEAARDYDGLLLLGPRVTAATLAGAGRLKVVARFGVGYDNVDVPACTAAGVLLTIAPNGVRRPVAAAAMAFVLALSHKLLVKDRLTRAGRWAEKLNHNGQGLTGRTLGVIGFGNIGRELAGLARPFDLRVIASDPWADPEAAAAAGVRLVPLDELLRESDYVVVCCALTAETRHLLDAGRIALMKPTAHLVNVARGPIVDQAALTAALRANRIAGAGLDVFDPEPVAPDDPLLALENVILTPHAICWTDECFGRTRSWWVRVPRVPRVPTF